MSRLLERSLLRPLAAADALFNRWYGWRLNPLYQSGTIVVALYLTLVATGLWLILFYRVGAPWESVARLTENRWTGNWVRALHRYASDAALVATLVHAARMVAQGRSWGPRTLAWVSGVTLLALVLLCGWTGYLMVWDTFGEFLAREGARMLDTLPILSEPTSRAFTGEAPVPSVFFFITLFAHIGIPLAMGVVFWLHVKRLARPAMLPPRRLMWTVIGVLTLVSIAWPLAMAPKANPFVRPAEIPVDIFFAFWVPLTGTIDGATAWAVTGLSAIILLLVPTVVARRGAAKPPPSVVDEAICTGCTQCSIDCPYGAIEMIARHEPDPRSELVAQVDPDLCVSCGICAGSCAPMGVGPPGRTGRDQLVTAQAFVTDVVGRDGQIVVVACEHGARASSAPLTATGAAVYPVSCAGNLHTSVIERLIRGGAGGVLILACPPRDCWNREGPRWLFERVYNDREAELQPRVDRRRVRIAHAGAGEPSVAIAALRAFQADVAALGLAPGAALPETEPVCDPPDPPEVEEVHR
jgi:ferredoxin